ncbi:MAG: hypothetical protein BHV84_08850 [Prevotella sp. AG:487_50_53]|nr:MAG: hypothetical protein BHV84_08850 [Prevotella sp. AG:487_50_53]
MTYIHNILSDRRLRLYYVFTLPPPPCSKASSATQESPFRTAGKAVPRTGRGSFMTENGLHRLKRKPTMHEKT